MKNGLVVVVDHVLGFKWIYHFNLLEAKLSEQLPSRPRTSRVAERRATSNTVGIKEDTK